VARKIALDDIVKVMVEFLRVRRMDRAELSVGAERYNLANGIGYVSKECTRRIDGETFHCLT